MTPKAVIVHECFEDESQKADVLKGAASVFPKKILYGGSAYGMYTQAGVLDIDAVSMLAIGGDVLSVVQCFDRVQAGTRWGHTRFRHHRPPQDE